MDNLFIDPRTKSYIFYDSVYPVIAVIGSYLYFCLKCGPQFMERRPPYELKKTILVYNFSQILLSVFMAYRGTRLSSEINWLCMPLDYSDTPFNNEVFFLCHVYVVAKFIELLDTVFFVLRKKFSHISTLHLFHHTFMSSASWLGLKYVGSGGHLIMFGLINCYVHIVMYSYYLIANLGPEYKKYLWWKKYVTIMQLAQFGFIFFHNAYSLFSSCSYPKHYHVLVIMFDCIFLYMFGNFYINTYVRTPKKEVEKRL